MTGIYMYTNKLNNKKYIGQSLNIAKRKSEHLKRKDTNSKFDKYLQKLGIEQFEFVVLEECSADKLDEREIYWIQFYDSTNPDKGYNLTAGGKNQRGENNISAKLTEEQVLKIIKMLEENKLDDTAIAEKFNIHRNSVNNINRCRTWSNVHGYKENIRNEYSQKKFKRNANAGAGNPTAKITEEKAKQIIEMLKTSSLSMPKIAAQLNVSIYIVEDINRCRTWKHLHNFTQNIRKEYKGG